jgi:hypothetical protein
LHSTQELERPEFASKTGGRIAVADDERRGWQGVLREYVCREFAIARLLSIGANDAGGAMP